MITAQVEAPWQEPVDGERVGGHGGRRDSKAHVGRRFRRLNWGGQARMAGGRMARQVAVVVVHAGHDVS